MLRQTSACHPQSRVKSMLSRANGIHAKAIRLAEARGTPAGAIHECRNIPGSEATVSLSAARHVVRYRL